MSDNPLAAPLQRALALVKAVWMQSGEGTAVISDHVESRDGDANHWSGVERWVMRDSDAPADSRDLAQLRAEVDQLRQEVEFWKTNSMDWRRIALLRRAAADKVVERIARWAHEEANGWRDQGDPSWENTDEETRDSYRASARASLRAAIEGEQS